MSVEQKPRTCRLAGNLKMKFRHFAKGTYPCFVQNAYSVNRLLLILENPSGPENTISDARETYEMRPGCFYLVPAFHPAAFRFDALLRFFSIHFNLEFWEGMDLFSRRDHIFEQHAPEMISMAERIFSMNPPLAAAAGLQALTNLSVSLCAEQMTGKEWIFTECFAAYRPVIDYISAHCNARVSVDDLAATMKMRRDVFTRKFTTDTGISPKRFFNRVLLDKASELLRDPRFSIRETAFRLQFSSEYYFSRFFKRYSGIPPRRFREEYSAGF